MKRLDYVPFLIAADVLGCACMYWSVAVDVPGLKVKEAHKPAYFDS